MKKLIKIILILIIILIIAGLIGAGYVYKKGKAFLVENSQEQAIELPQIAIAKEAFQEKRKNFDDFIDNLDDGKCEGQYELTGEEANVLIKDDDKMLLTKWIYLNVKDSKIDAVFSVPLKDALSEDKYLNGTSNATAGYNLNGDNKITISVSSFKLGDKELIEGQNKDYSYDPQDDLKDMLKAVDKIYLENDKIIIKCKE